MKKFALLFMSAMAFFVVSCEDPIPYSTDESEYMYFSGQKGTQSFTFYANGDWKIESNQNWIHVSRYFGWSTINDKITVEITCDLNDGMDNRSGSLWISVNNDGIYGSVYIQQECVNIDFKDRRFKAYCVEYYDRNEDHEINLGEALAAKGFDPSDLGISTMDEIEYFANLTTLFCQNNQLTSLYLRNNTKLGFIDCHDNQITFLDLSKNQELYSLDCSNNQLSTLNLSKNKFLTHLNIDGNPLTKLILYKYHDLPDSFIEKYKKIIEYAQ